MLERIIISNFGAVALNMLIYMIIIIGGGKLALFIENYIYIFAPAWILSMVIVWLFLFIKTKP